MRTWPDPRVRKERGRARRPPQKTSSDELPTVDLDLLHPPVFDPARGEEHHGHPYYSGRGVTPAQVRQTCNSGCQSPTRLKRVVPPLAFLIDAFFANHGALLSSDELGRRRHSSG